MFKSTLPISFDFHSAVLDLQIQSLFRREFLSRPYRGQFYFWAGKFPAVPMVSPRQIAPNFKNLEKAVKFLMNIQT